MHKNKSLQEQGFVSIIVAALIMIILSLITIGFTRVMQREQRQSLDRQLTRQALYAAESGINDVYAALQEVDLPAEKTDCVDGTEDLGLATELDSNGDIEYTCILYDKTPIELVYSVSTADSKITEIKTESGAPFFSMTVRWGQENEENNISALPACGTAEARVFPSSRTGVVPLMRIDLTDLTTLSRDALINGTDYLYLAPCRGPTGTSHVFLSGEQGTIVPVACDGEVALPCSLVITGLTSNSYTARIKSVYESAQVVISGEEGAAGSTSTVEFSQSQTSIDVTARAGDIVRRLRVAVPLFVADNPPESVFQAFDGVCKLLSVDTDTTPARVTDGCL